MTEFYVAKLDTRSFAFEAYGDSESQAKAALLAGLKRHAKQYLTDKDWPREAMRDAEVRQVFTNMAYRDRHPLEIEP